MAHNVARLQLQLHDIIFSQTSVDVIHDRKIRVRNKTKLCIRSIPMGTNLAVCIVQVVPFKCLLNSQRFLASLLLSPSLGQPREAALYFLNFEVQAWVLLAGLSFGPFFFLLFAGVEFVKSSERPLFEFVPFLMGLDS